MNDGVMGDVSLTQIGVFVCVCASKKPFGFDEEFWDIEPMECGGDCHDIRTVIPNG
jgi:hypothetical protein